MVTEVSSEELVDPPSLNPITHAHSNTCDFFNSCTCTHLPMLIALGSKEKGFYANFSLISTANTMPKALARQIHKHF